MAREITQTVATDEGSVSFGVQLWPHTDDKPVTKSVTYRNAGAAPVTLSLAVQTKAAAGTFTAGATTLTVPAGGKAQTTLTADTAVAQPDGLLSGYLVAVADGGVRVDTPFSVDRGAAARRGQEHDGHRRRAGRLASVATPRSGAGIALFSVHASWQVPDGVFDATMIGAGSLHGVYAGQIAAAKPQAGFHGEVAATYARPTADGSFRQHPLPVRPGVVPARHVLHRFRGGACAAAIWRPCGPRTRRRRPARSARRRTARCSARWTHPPARSDTGGTPAGARPAAPAHRPDRHHALITRQPLVLDLLP